MALVLFVLGLGLEGRFIDRLEMELIADGKAEVKSLRRVEVADSSRLTTGRSGRSDEKSWVLGSSLLLVWRWPGRCKRCW
jgi:hypothetical protein